MVYVQSSGYTFVNDEADSGPGAGTDTDQWKMASLGIVITGTRHSKRAVH